MRTVLVALVAVSQVALAKGSSSDLSNENCTYGGFKLDLGAMPNTKGKVNSVPEDFTGFVTCTDPETKHIYEEYQMVKGERVGNTKQYDRRNGRLSEVIPYEKGVRHGCVKRYDTKSGHLEFEFCVDHDEPSGLMKNFDGTTGRLTRIKWVNKRSESSEATEIQFNSKGQPTSLQCGPQTLVGPDDLWCGRGGRDGEVTLYAEEGWPSRVVGYRNGKQHGWERRYHKDGHVMSEARYENGKEVESHATGASGTYERKQVGDNATETVLFEQSKKPRLVVERIKGRISKETAYFANGKTKYEKVAQGEQYAVKTYTDDGSLESVGTYVVRWSDDVGLWGLDAVGSYKFYVKGALLEEFNFDQNGRPDGIQKLFDRENPKKLLRREKWEQGTLRWSEDVMKNGDVRHREHAEDGSVKSENVSKAAQDL